METCYCKYYCLLSSQQSCTIDTIIPNLKMSKQRLRPAQRHKLNKK